MSGADPIDAVERADGGPSDPAPLAAVPVLFCRDCGTPWDPQWQECPHCAQRRGSRDAAASYRGDLGRIKSAVALYFALLAVSVVMIIAALSAREPLGAQAETIATIAFSVITVCWCIKSRSELWPLLKQPVSLHWFIIAILSAVGTYLAASGAMEAMKLLGMQEIRMSDPLIAEGWGLGAIALLVCVQPGVFEELAFRGVIQSSLTPSLGRVEGLLVTALMFAVLHLSVPSMPHLVIIGLVLGWLRLKTGSLLPGMVMHFSHNLLVVLGERSGGLLPW